jgi:hypothetical protein
VVAPPSQEGYPTRKGRRQKVARPAIPRMANTSGQAPGDFSQGRVLYLQASDRRDSESLDGSMSLVLFTRRCLGKLRPGSGRDTLAERHRVKVLSGNSSGSPTGAIAAPASVEARLGQACPKHSVSARSSPGQACPEHPCHRQATHRGPKSANADDMPWHLGPAAFGPQE